MGFSAGSGSGSISGSNDVSLSNPIANQALSYNGSTAKWQNKSLSTVATSGNYADLLSKPTIPDISTVVANTDLDSKTAALISSPSSALNSALSTTYVPQNNVSSIVAGTNISLVQSGSTVTVSAVSPFQLVTHGTTASAARPTSAQVVLWVGSVQPTNMTIDDIWSSQSGLQTLNTLNTTVYSFDSNINGWAGINATVAQSTNVVRSGTGSLQVTATGGNLKSIGSNGFIASGVGQLWTMSSYVRADSTSVSVTSHIEYFDANYNYLGAATDSNVTATSTGWMYTSVSGTTPSGTTQVHPVVTTTSVAASGIIYYVDDVTITKSVS